MNCPFDAEIGSVWVYEKDTREENYFVVLADYSDNVEGEQPGVKRRQYLDLKEGMPSWFARHSHLNYKSKRA